MCLEQMHSNVGIGITQMFLRLTFELEARCGGLHPPEPQLREGADGWKEDSARGGGGVEIGEGKGAFLKPSILKPTPNLEPGILNIQH